MKGLVLGVFLWLLAAGAGFPVDKCRNVSKGSNIPLFTVTETDGFVLIKHDITMKFEILDGELTKSCSNCAFRDGLAILTDVKPEDAGIYHLEHMDHGKTSVYLCVVTASESGFPVDECRNVSKGSNITLFTVTETDGFVLIKHDFTMKFEILDGELTKSCSNCAFRDGLAILTDVKFEDAGIYHLEHMDHGKTSVCLGVVAAPESGHGESGLTAVIACGTIVTVAVIAIAILICRSRSRKSYHYPGPRLRNQQINPTERVNLFSMVSTGLTPTSDRPPLNEATRQEEASTSCQNPD